MQLEREFAVHSRPFKMPMQGPDPMQMQRVDPIFGDPIFGHGGGGWSMF